MGKRKKYYKSRVPLGGSVSKNSSYKTPLARRLQRGEEPNSSGAQSTVLDQSSSAEGGASVGSAEFDSLNNAVIARFCQDRGVIAVDLSNAIVPLAITYSEHLSLKSVGYGALVPKAKDVLKVKLVDKAENGEYCKAATDRYEIESVRLFQLSPRSPEEWLTFVEATRRHLESSGSNASIDDIGNLEIVWGQLLTADFSYVLSSAIGRFLLALRSRCRELHQYSLDSAFDWLLDQLMLSDCLSRLMKPLLLRAINLKQVKAAAVANEESENADQQILGPLTRLICSKDETVLNCKLLPMARELAPSQSNNDLLSLLHCRRLLQPASSCSTTRKPIGAVSNCESLSTEDYCEIIDAVELQDKYFEMPETRTEPFEEDGRVKISEDNHDAKSLMTPPISQSLEQQKIAASAISSPPLRFSLSKRLGQPLQHWPLPECFTRQSKSPPIPEDQGESLFSSERRPPLPLQNNRKRTRSRSSSPPELFQLQPHRRTAHDRLGKRPKRLRHSSPSEDQTRLPPKSPSHSPLPSVSQGQCSSDSAIVNRQRSKLKNSSVMADIIAWSSEGFGALIIDEKPNERYVVPISREEHISHLNVGYGFLEPKVKDVLKVTFKKTRRKNNDSDDETDSDEDSAIESVQLFQLSPRSPEEWLIFVEATRCHLESSGLKAKVNDIGNLEIVWGQLLTVDFSYVLSSATGRFLLALRRRCRRFHRCSWDSAYDWILERLMNPERLCQLMMPLVKMATTGNGQHLEPIRSVQDKTEPENSDMSMAITESEHTKKSESISCVEASASGESMDLKTKQIASAAHKLFCELARLTCAKDASVLDRVLLPMAQSLTTVIDPVEEDAEEDQQRRCHSILLEMLTVSVELQRRQQAALKTAGRGGILPSYAELTAESNLVSSTVDGTQMKTSNWLAGLQPALEIGAYRTVEEYIETMLGLLRADCFDKFHECMKQVKSGKLSKDSGLRLYLNVKVAAVKVATRGAALRIAVTFDLPAKDKGPSNWSKSSRLMQGNLLCLSLDEKFSQYFWATVVEKRQDELTKNERLVWIQPCKPERSGLSVGEALVTILVNSTAASSGMLMLESPSMFRAFQPVLASLQSLSADCVPFADVLASAKVDSACIEPDFVTRYYNNEEPKTPLPSIKLPAGLNLDHCQAEAFANALHRRVYVCQGPPGTGKTLLGVLIAKQLLQLETLKGRPLLVLCYKNHALDEFLIKLLPEYEHRMVRVGGRSRDTRLENIGLRAVRSRIKAFRPVNRLLDRLRENWEELKSCLEFLNRIFETPAGAIINACDYRQLYSIVHCGHVRDAALNDAHESLKSVPPERLFVEINKTTETYSAFNASVGFCLPSLPQGLEENRPQNLKVKLQAIKSKSTGQKLKENDEEDDGEEIREREEQLAMGARDDGPSTGNEMRINVDLIRQSQLYLDSSIEECSQKDFMQRLLLKLPTQLSHTEQWLFYQLALNKICKETKERIEMLVEKIMELEADLEQTNTEADVEVLSRMRVVE
ncbi:hypothetical protein BOX15_Mlig020045g1 [Macrostomum lignano]|uniref:Uncharacterized protein n=1 Tax=Macrostomum lignano TaxID=282301 RepID=A0A267GHT4_9PLAT|nr:hypothetical protein BOX15_Mlig020045g1 [Macrostomum lignano]